MLVIFNFPKVRNRLPWWLRQWRICLQYSIPGFSHWVRKIPWRREGQPTPVFLPGESHGQRSLVGYSPWGHKELDGTAWPTHTHKVRCSSQHGSFHPDSEVARWTWLWLYANCITQARNLALSSPHPPSHSQLRLFSGSLTNFTC